MVFRPKPQYEINIANNTYRFTEHPSARGMVYGQSGRRATVYQLTNQNQQLFALKVFTRSFRTPHTEAQAAGIAHFARLPGLAACQRWVISPSTNPELVYQYPDLEFAVLMPWIGGTTWQEIILKRQAISRGQSLLVAENLIHILNVMELNQLAHCDLSGPNVIVDLNSYRALGESTGGLALIDLEDLYAPGLQQPERLPAGSAGYGHPSFKKGIWTPEADRFAAAILLAEMLTWSDERVRVLAYGEQYFAPEEIQETSERFGVIQQSLFDRWGKAFADSFTQAWFSKDLIDCPPIHFWAELLDVKTPQRENTEKSTSGPFSNNLPLQYGNHVTVERPTPARQDIYSTSERTIEENANSAKPEKKRTLLYPSLAAGLIFLLIGCLFASASQIGLIRDLGSLDNKEAETTILDIDEKIQNPSENQTYPTASHPTTSPLIDTAVPTITPANKNVIDTWKQGHIIYVQKKPSEAVLYYSSLSEMDNPEPLMTAKSENFLLGAALSRDGKRVSYYQYPDTLYEVEIQNPFCPVQLGNCQSPSWGIDNSLVCRASSGKFIMLEGNSSNFSGGRGTTPAWTGDNLVYAVIQDGVSQIYRSSTDGTNSVMLAGESTENYAPAWSPDGKWIAYQSNQESNNSEIWVMDLNGNHKQRLTYTPNGGWSRAPSWSPDGKWIAFVSNRDQSIGSDFGEIYVISINTGEETRITKTDGQIYDWRVTWGK